MRAVGRHRLRPPGGRGQDAGGEGSGAGACDGRRQCSAAGSCSCRRFPLDPGGADGTEPGATYAGRNNEWTYHPIIPVCTVCRSGLWLWGRQLCPSALWPHWLLVMVGARLHAGSPAAGGRQPRRPGQSLTQVRPLHTPHAIGAGTSTVLTPSVPQWLHQLWPAPNAAAQCLYVLQGSCGVAHDAERTRGRRKVVGAVTCSRRCLPQARTCGHWCDPPPLVSVDACLLMTPPATW